MSEIPNVSPESKEMEPITLEQTCVIGSVFYKDYQVENSEGSVRGHEAIDSLMKIAEKGYKAAVIIGEGTDQKFLDDLKKRLSGLGDKGENIVWHIQEKPGYSEARRESVILAWSKYPETKAFIMQEIEKDLTKDQGYEKFLDALSDNKILVMMNRGIDAPYNGNYFSDANIPKEQFWGERHQNIEMAGQENAAGLTKKEHDWDRLSDTRAIRNEEIEIGNTKINPADLILLKYQYVDGYNEGDRKNKIDAYSAAVYNMVPILEALGFEDQMAEAPIKYAHSEKQREQEEGNPVFRAKRLGHKVDLPAINFDIVANIVEWKKEGKWPSILLEAIKGDHTLNIKHFNEDDYSLTGTILRKNPAF